MVCEESQKFVFKVEQDMKMQVPKEKILKLFKEPVGDNNEN